ncbi:MAG: hypothetical protein K8R90_01555 [Candidatus Cloacimonetes bacterium]|nr:hypothetical protein [Candidatus Cloacimonadota bacterium]
MNEHLMRVYSQESAPSDRAAQQHGLRQQRAGLQKSLVQNDNRAHTFSVRPDELTQLLSDDEKDALSAIFTGGHSPHAYGATTDGVRFCGALVDRTV